MPKTRYHVRLSPAERSSLLDLVSKGSATSIMRANVLLAADENHPSDRKTEGERDEFYHVNKQMVHTIRQNCAWKSKSSH